MNKLRLTLACAGLIWSAVDLILVLRKNFNEPKITELPKE